MSCEGNQFCATGLVDIGLRVLFPRVTPPVWTIKPGCGVLDAVRDEDGAEFHLRLLD